MNQDNSPPRPSQDEVRLRAWAEIRELLELQLAPLGQRALQAIAPAPGESVLDIGCGGGETALELVGAVAPDGKVVGIDLSAAVLHMLRRLVGDEAFFLGVRRFYTEQRFKKAGTNDFRDRKRVV